MDEQQNTGNRPVNPRRRKRSKMKIFKEVYLPVIIAGAVVLLLLTFIIGSITRAIQRAQYNEQLKEASAQSESRRLEQQGQEADALLAEAAALTRHFDYEGAIKLLETFTGDTEEFPEVASAITEYTQAQADLVLWDDPGQVLNLSFQLLIADPQRAYSNATYSHMFQKNFVTTEEFSRILRQLYENGYILISLEDMTTSDGPVDLYLPEDKKPLIITQTNVNYNTYLVDGDGDRVADKDGGGFASRMVLDANGNITCEMVDAQGNTVTGAFDLVPILDAFVETHPDFSYKGAKAILSLTGYDGLFGYRTNPAAEATFGTEVYEEGKSMAMQIAQRLRETGYELACYSYENISYKSSSAAKIAAEMEQWQQEVHPLLDFVNIFVFAQYEDIAGNDTDYSGEKFQVLYNAGFRYFLGFCDGGEPFYSATGNHIRMGRLLVAGGNLKANPEWFEGLFDVASVLDPNRTA